MVIISTLSLYWHDKKFDDWVQIMLSTYYVERILEIFHLVYIVHDDVKSIHPDFVVRLRILWPFVAITIKNNEWKTVMNTS